MSDTKWTPGPWRVGLNGSPSVRSVWTDGGDYHRFVASTECPANAKIISAAPDMAEALERFVTFHSGHVLSPELVGTMKLARAALAKAKGEA